MIFKINPTKNWIMLQKTFSKHSFLLFLKRMFLFWIFFSQKIILNFIWTRIWQCLHVFLSAWRLQKLWDLSEILLNCCLGVPWGVFIIIFFSIFKSFENYCTFDSFDNNIEFELFKIFRNRIALCFRIRRFLAKENTGF